VLRCGATAARPAAIARGVGDSRPAECRPPAPPGSAVGEVETVQAGADEGDDLIRRRSTRLQRSGRRPPGRRRPPGQPGQVGELTLAEVELLGKGQRRHPNSATMAAVNRVWGPRPSRSRARCRAPRRPVRGRHPSHRRPRPARGTGRLPRRSGPRRRSCRSRRPRRPRPAHRCRPQQGEQSLSTSRPVWPGQPATALR